jgi:RimJ/RimL family protein N-acetyltransferase
MRLVRDDSENVAAWVASLLPDVRPMGFVSCKAIGVVSKDGDPLGGAVFHDYQPQYKTISVSCAAVSPRWLTRGIVAEILGYAFDEIGMFKLWSAVSIHNHRSLKLIQGLGFTKEGTLRHQFGAKNHAVIFGMIAPEFTAKYRKDRYGQQAQSAHAA